MMDDEKNQKTSSRFHVRARARFCLRMRLHPHEMRHEVGHTLASVRFTCCCTMGKSLNMWPDCLISHVQP